jgi:putative transposase
MGGKSILEVCREHNISEVSFHRWKRQFGQWEVQEARRLKELEWENGALKKMLAEALLKNRAWAAVCEKNSQSIAVCGRATPCLRRGWTNTNPGSKRVVRSGESVASDSSSETSTPLFPNNSPAKYLTLVRFQAP